MLTEQEFHQIAESQLNMVYRLALSWLRSPADAEDAAQNAMLRLWRTPGGSGTSLWRRRSGPPSLRTRTRGRSTRR